MAERIVLNRFNSLLQWCLNTRYVRQITDAVLRARCRATLARFDQQDPVRCQSQLLIGLVHRARATRFGRDHDFRRIRTVADFRRLVPLCTPADLWRHHWLPAFPHLDGITWPGPLTLSDEGLPSPGGTRPLVRSPALLNATRQALRLALAFLVDSRPAARLLSGQTLFLDSDLPLSSTQATEGQPVLRSGRGLSALPKLIRSYTLVASAFARSSDGDSALSRLADEAAHLPLTSLVGGSGRLLQLFSRVKQVTKRDRLLDVWPNLTAVLFARRAGEQSASRLRAEVGSRVQVLEMGLRPEAAITLEDPRHGLPRLLHNHGVFFEFIPFSEAAHPRPRRLGLDEVQTGVLYELAITSPAGLWACRIGCTILFERLNPPLLRFVEAPRPLARRTDLVPLTGPVQPPHPHSAGSRAAPPGTTFHTPWSAPVDRE